MAEDLEACQLLLSQYADRLSAWEVDFLENIEGLLEHGLGLSPKQQGCLDSIWHRVVVANPDRNRPSMKKVT